LAGGVWEYEAEKGLLGLRVRKLPGTGGNYRRGNSVICVFHQTLFGWYSQEDVADGACGIYWGKKNVYRKLEGKSPLGIARHRLKVNV
jgi:hypothetical protein